MRQNQFQSNTMKLTLAGVFIAIAVVGSLFVVPVLGSRCAPVQHLINILSAVLLGPGYALGFAFGASLLRNAFALGTMMAFPGSLFGALISGVLYARTKRIGWAVVGEVAGTSILGGLSAYPVAVLLMGKDAAVIAFYAYIIPFFVSTAGGALLALIILTALRRTGRLSL